MMRAFDRQKVARDLRRPHASPSLAEGVQRSLEHKHAAQRQVDWQALRRRAHAIKAYAIANLGELLVRFENEFAARGGTVLWARTGQEAVEHVVAICRKHAVTSVVKGKSMLSEELDLCAHLQAAGIEAVETDLGEFIVQLAGQRPSHIVAPALHLSRADVGELFHDELGVPFTDDPKGLSAIARERLRTRYLAAGLGVTGANFGIAETGTIVVVENEGNGGMSAGTPPVHVALMGIEKLIPRLEDLPVFLQLLARAGTGQKLTTYTHHFLGPEPGKAAYCIIVDAGRTALLADPKTRESLYCIRCGACLNVCPIYRRVGGWAYGGVYGGPIGAAITPPMVGIGAAGELPFASTLCGACREECPVDIDLPQQLVYLRRRAFERPRSGRIIESRAMRAFAKSMMTLGAYRRALSIARALAPIAERLPWKPAWLGAWMGRRSAPRIAPQTFKEWWRQRA